MNTRQPAFPRLDRVIGVSALGFAALNCIVGSAVLYLICCLGLLRLRTRQVAAFGPPFVVRGGALVPIAASAIIVWMLSTVAWTELAATASLVALSGAIYGAREYYAARARADELPLVGTS